MKRLECEIVRVLLVPNTRYEAAVSAALELTPWLTAQGFEPVFVSDDAIAVGLESHGIASSAIGSPALVVALGGDGTILKAAHLLGEIEAPILGVNLGSLGFLSGAHADDLRDAVESALAGECRVERRATLEAHVVMDGREVGQYRALNEISVGRGEAARVVRIELRINDVELAEFDCDGVIVATATGSTAYALSAGGPIVSPDVPCSVVVPVAPHSFDRRAIVAGPSDIVELRLPDPARREACVSVDGDLMPCRQAIESISVKRGETDVLLVKLNGRDFYDVVHAEFYGGR